VVLVPSLLELWLGVACERPASSLPNPASSGSW